MSPAVSPSSPRPLRCAREDGTPADALPRRRFDRALRPEDRERALEIRRERRLELDLALEARVIEPQALGVEEVTAREARRRGGGAESPVARDGMADRREMDADLVLPSRLGRCAKEREAPITLEHLE